MAFWIGEHGDGDTVRDTGHRHERLAASLRHLVEVGLRIIDLDVDGHPGGAAHCLSDAAADAPAFVVEHAVVAHFGNWWAELPAEHVAVELLKLDRVGTDDLEPGNRVRHRVSP